MYILKAKAESSSSNKSERKDRGEAEVFTRGFIRDKDEVEAFNRLHFFNLGRFPEDEDRERFNKTTC